MEENENIGFLVKRIQNEVGKSFCDVREGEALTLTQMRVLIHLSQKGGEGITQRELERILSVSHPTVVGIVKRLELRGLVRSVVDETDRRLRRVYPTQLALEQHSRMDTHKARIEEALTNGMSEEEIAQFRSYLKRAYQNAVTMNERTEKDKEGNRL